MHVSYVYKRTDVLTIGEERALELIAIMERTKRALADLGEFKGEVHNQLDLSDVHAAVRCMF